MTKDDELNYEKALSEDEIRIIENMLGGPIKYGYADPKILDEILESSESIFKYNMEILEKEKVDYSPSEAEWNIDID